MKQPARENHKGIGFWHYVYSVERLLVSLRQEAQRPTREAQRTRRKIIDTG
jgi:cytochrome b561